MKSVRRVSLCVLALLAFTAACAPPPAPTGPAWSRFQWQRTASATTTTDRTGAWTDGTWFATIRRTTTSGGTTHKLEVSQRSASNPLALSAAQLLPLNTVADSYGPKIFGESFIAVQQGEIISFFRPSASGVWAVAGEMTVPPGFLLDGLTDSWMVLRRPGYIGAPDGEVNVYAVNATGATIATSLETTLTAPTTAGFEVPCGAAGFGNTGTRIDGDLLAIGSGNCGLNPSALRAVSVLRHLGGSWQFVQTLRHVGSNLVGYAKSFDVDDGPTVDRIVVGSSLTTYPYGSNPVVKVEVFEDTGSGFSLAQTLLPDPADDGSTTQFGSLVTISGRVLGIVTRIAAVPTTIGGPASLGYYVGGYTQSPAGTWTRETEKAIFSNPEAAGTAYVIPAAMQAERDTIAVLGVSALSPAPGCIGLCPTDGWRAWFLDRTP